MFRLLTVAVLLIGLVTSTSALARNFDPTTQVVPLDDVAEIYRLGDVSAASMWLDDAVGSYVRLHNVLVDATPSSSSSRRISLMLTLNIAIADHLKCQIEQGWIAVGDLPAACNTVDGPWDPLIDLIASWIARGFLREQFIGERSAGSAMYSGSDMFGLLRVDDDDPQVPDFCAFWFTIMNFATARLVRGYITEGLTESAYEAIENASDNYWRSANGEDLGSTLVPASAVSLTQICAEEFADENALDAILTYQAILATVEDDHWTAWDAGRKALESDAPSAFDSDYEHPLLWALAASRLMGDDNDGGRLLELARTLSDGFSPDAQVALDLFIDGPTTDGVSPGCTSAGCHYFAAQYFEGLGDRDAAARELESGARLCHGTTSIPCTAITVALDRSEAAP